MKTAAISPQRTTLADSGHARPVVMRRKFRMSPLSSSSLMQHAVKNAGLMIYELLGIAELTRVAYEKGELASVQERLKLLVVEAANLASAVSDILDLDQIESEPTGPLREQFDIVALLHDVAEAGRALAGSKAVTVMDVSCPAPVVLTSDPSLIRKIMQGLLSNAVKFTDRGRISLIMSRDDGELKMTVADTGRGMTQEEIDSILDRTLQKYDGKTAGSAASGLGLRIVKALVGKLDGKLIIASKQGEGTIVTVSLPLK